MAMRQNIGLVLLADREDRRHHPLVLGIVGLIALVAGFLLGRRQRPTVDDEPSVMSPEYTS